MLKYGDVLFKRYRKLTTPNRMTHVRCACANVYECEFVCYAAMVRCLTLLKFLFPLTPSIAFAFAFACTLNLFIRIDAIRGIVFFLKICAVPFV